MSRLMGKTSQGKFETYSKNNLWQWQRRKAGKSQHKETYRGVNTRDRSKQQEELTGFDVVGHGAHSVGIGSIAENCDVRCDCDLDHTLNVPLSLLLRHSF